MKQIKCKQGVVTTNNVKKFKIPKESEAEAIHRAVIEKSIIDSLNHCHTNILDHLEHGIDCFKGELAKLKFDNKIKLKIYHRPKAKGYSGGFEVWYDCNFETPFTPQSGGGFCFTFTTFYGAFDVVFNEFLSYKKHLLSIRMITSGLTAKELTSDNFKGEVVYEITKQKRTIN